VGAEFHVTGLGDWTVQKGFSVRTRNGGKSRTIKQANRATKPVRLSDDSSISFEAKYEGPISFIRAKSLRLSEIDIIKISTSSNESLDDILARVVVWQSFISFATRRAAYLEEMRVSMSDGANALWIVPRSRSDSASSSGPLFTRKDLADGLSRYLRAWNDNFREIEPVISLYLGVGYQATLYYSLRFLSYVQALETFHRRTRKGEFQKHPEFKRNVLSKLTEALPNQMNTDYRARIVAGMIHLNEWSLLQRLYDLYDRDLKTVSRLFRDRDKDMRWVRDVRNYLTHYEGKTTMS
jgi:hypothetical protein